MTPNRLAGHTLPHEGRVLVYGGWSKGPGKARCSCGAESSETLPTIAARQRWHRWHKDAVRTAEHSA